MSFHDILFPDEVSRGARFGPGHNTAIHTQQGGSEERVGLWETPRHRFRFSLEDHEPEEVLAIRDFVVARRGALFSFRIKDWSDYATTSTGTLHNKDDVAVDDEDVEIGTGDGSETQFQLVKFYEPASLYTRARNITLPRSGTVVLALDGVAQTEGTDFSVNYTTGIVTLASAPATGVSITAGFEFDVLVRWDAGVDEFLGLEVRDFDHVDLPDLDAVEVRDELPVPGERYPGGSKFHENLMTDVSITQAEGLHHDVEASATSLKVYLPRADDLARGIFQFSIHNAGAFAFDVVNDEDAVVINVDSDETALLHLGTDSGGSKVWIAHA